MSQSVAERRSVQVSARAHRWLQEVAELEHVSMGRVLERALERYRAEVILQAHNAAWARLMAEDPDAITAFQHEQDAWDRTLADGLIEGEA